MCVYYNWYIHVWCTVQPVRVYGTIGTCVYGTIGICAIGTYTYVCTVHLVYTCVYGTINMITCTFYVLVCDSMS